jgi:hypothetical protein
MTGTLRSVGIVVVALASSAVGLVAQGGMARGNPPAPQGNAGRAAIERQLVANETKINEAVAKGDLAGFKAQVASSAWTVDPGGPMSVADFEKNMSALKIESGWKISDSRVQWVDDTTAILIYKWTGKGSFNGQPIAPATWSSTVWHQQGGTWKAMFHQETAIPDAK